VNERATRTIRNLYIENERVIYISLVITIGNERVSCLSSICILVKASCFYLSIYVFLQFKNKTWAFYLNSFPLSLLDLYASDMSIYKKFPWKKSNCYLKNKQELIHLYINTRDSISEFPYLFN